MQLYPQVDDGSVAIQCFFDDVSETFTYVLSDKATQRCAVIDPVLDYDPSSGCTSTQSINHVIEYIKHNQLKLEWILETHAHADHLTAAMHLKNTLQGNIVIGEHITAVQADFKHKFNLEGAFATNGEHFDRLVKDQDTLLLGKSPITVMALPGHTPACVAYQVNNHVFVGDTFMAEDVGTARCDFPGGDAKRLYASIQKLYALADTTNLYLCHDYPPAVAGATPRPHKFHTTIAQQKAHNIHVHTGISLEDFVAMREARDRALKMPRLVLPAIQLNIRAGALPPAEANGQSYFKIPITALK